MYRRLIHSLDTNPESNFYSSGRGPSESDDTEIRLYTYRTNSSRQSGMKSYILSPSPLSLSIGFFFLPSFSLCQYNQFRLIARSYVITLAQIVQKGKLKSKLGAEITRVGR